MEVGVGREVGMVVLELAGDHLYVNYTVTPLTILQCNYQSVNFVCLEVNQATFCLTP